MSALFRVWLIALIAILLSPMESYGQAYPSRPVRILVPFPPGGSTDVFARLYAQSLSEELGQPFVVENRAGATGSLGASMVAKAAPDGYMLLATPDLPVVKAPALLKVHYDPEKDLLPIAFVGEDANILVAHPGAGFKTLPELVTAAKAKPDSINFASAGNGSPGHLCGEMINLAAGIKLTHVAYNGAGPAMTAALSGEVQLFCGPVLVLLPNIASGKLTALAVTGDKMLPQLAGIKPLSDTWPGLGITTWYGFLAPGGTPPAIRDQLRQALRKAYDDGAIRDRLEKAGIEPRWIDGQAAQDRVRADLEKWRELVQKANIKAD